MDKKQIIQQLRKKRYTYNQIGKLLNISRQRVHQIFTKAKYKKGSPNSFRDIIRDIDNNECQVCGRKNCNDSNKRKLSVHHLDGNNKNNSFHNLMSLCSQCHAMVHKNS